MVVERSGVVLIDEVEAHLHPTWQQKLPQWLKTHFPGLQFLVTTHSPLVAQAADPNGLFVLPSPDDPNQEVRCLTGIEYDKIRMGRAEKTLLGTAFGLKTVQFINLSLKPFVSFCRNSLILKQQNRSNALLVTRFSGTCRVKRTKYSSGACISMFSDYHNIQKASSWLTRPALPPDAASLHQDFGLTACNSEALKKSLHCAHERF
ncbi:MAG: AAA family ATPase [Magnetococcales bacterium]|nr:AAA family ATPase [Magnetococcales bacterium]